MIIGTITGAIAGFVEAFAVTPVELVKIRLQLQKESRENAYYKGNIDCIKKIYNEKGVRGLYQGHFANILRETPAIAAQFGSYYFVKNLLATVQGKDQKELGDISLMFAGGMAGFMCWLVSYPQDVIKTKIQMDLSGQEYRKNKYLFDGGFVDCALRIKKLDGYRGFWVGFLPQTYQSFIANAFLFLAYEKTKNLLV